MIRKKNDAVAAMVLRILHVALSGRWPWTLISALKNQGVYAPGKTTMLLYNKNTLFSLTCR